MFGTPPVRALFYEFPTEQELFNVSAQFLVGGDILVTPVLEPNVSIVSGLLNRSSYSDTYLQKPQVFSQDEEVSSGATGIHTRS